MIRYSIDEDPRPAVYFWLAIATAALSLGVGSAVESLSGKVLAPSSFALFGLVVTLFDKYLWKIWPISLLSGIPDISGLYTGHIEREIAGVEQPEKIEITARITQSWTKIEVCVESDKTISNVRTCGLSLKNADGISILYTYLVRDKILGRAANLYGEGTQELRLSIDHETRLAGSYYSTKFRGGSMTLVRQVANKKIQKTGVPSAADQ